jgi:SAM-dependent methyltransferase
LAALVANCGYQVTAVDQVNSYWPGGFFNRHHYAERTDITDSGFPAATFDAVTCLFVLEHIPDHWRAMREMFRLLRMGGILVLTGPYNEERFVEDVYRLADAGYGWDNAYICRVHSRSALDVWLADSPAEVLDQSWWKVFTWPLWTQGRACVRPSRAVATRYITSAVSRSRGASWSVRRRWARRRPRFIAGSASGRTRRE